MNFHFHTRDYGEGGRTSVVLPPPKTKIFSGLLYEAIPSVFLIISAFFRAFSVRSMSKIKRNDQFEEVVRMGVADFGNDRPGIRFFQDFRRSRRNDGSRQTAFSLGARVG